MLKPQGGFNLAIVTRRINWTANLFSLRIQARYTPYVAGQFTKLALYDEKGELIRRAYSIVNHPKDHQETGELEFLIVADSCGQLSLRLEQLNVGDKLLSSNVITKRGLSMYQLYLENRSAELYLEEFQCCSTLTHCKLPQDSLWIQRKASFIYAVIQKWLKKPAKA